MTRGEQRGGRRPEDHQLRKLARLLFEALRDGEGSAAEQVIEDAIGLGLSPAVIQSLVVQPAMVRLGELWESGGVSVADEHLATAITQRLLVRLFEVLSVVRPRSRERILLAAVEGQHHTLGLRMVADVLEGAGFDVAFLGADVPVGSLRTFAERHQPMVAGLAFGMASSVNCLADSICAVHEVSPQTRIMLGGRAVPPALRSAYPSVECSQDVLATVEELLAHPPQPVAAEVQVLLSTSVPYDLSALSAEDESLASRLAEATREASEAARGYVRLAGTYRDLAFRDPVTDLANRRAFDERMSEVRDGALLMIDVDNFKGVNDTHGHDTGDRLLRLVGQAITHSIRATDFAARVGGDEFAVILPLASQDTARAIAQRVRSTARETAEPTVSLSIGLAPLTEDFRAALRCGYGPVRGEGSRTGSGGGCGTSRRA